MKERKPRGAARNGAEPEGTAVRRMPEEAVVEGEGPQGGGGVGGRRAAVGGGAPGRARRAQESGAGWPCDEGGRPIVGGGGGVGHGESGEAGLVGCPAR